MKKPPADVVPPRITPKTASFVPPPPETTCAYCGVEITDHSVRDLRVTLLTSDKRMVAEISVNTPASGNRPGTRMYFCTVGCATNAATDMMREANFPQDPNDPVFPEVRAQFRGKISRFQLGYVEVSPAGQSAGSDAREDVHGAGYRRVTTPGFEDQVIQNPR